MKIKDFYENGVLIKRVVTDNLDEKKKELIGEFVCGPSFEEMVYEDNVKEAMRLILDKLKTEKMNILLFGSAGTGKTQTAKMIAKETNKPFIYLTGSNSTQKIKEMLLNAKDNAIVLIDEIHNLPEKVAEIIYPAIQDNEIYSNGEKIKLNLMFIGTTTEPEKLPKPLLNRFKLIEFEELGIEKMREVLLKKGLIDEVINPLLNFTNNFRIINNVLDMMKLYGDFTELNLRKVFRLKKIDIYTGLSEYQEKYLEMLKNSEKPIGLRQIGLRLRKSEDYIKYEIEPDLIRKSMIFISSKGRELEPAMKQYGYEQLKKESEKHHAKFTQEDRKIAIEWLKDKKGITEKLGKRYLEVVNFVAEQIANGLIPDEVDLESFGTDVSIKESFENNYLMEF
jgi:Holliday junction resolvasome RuvABC ATP-dependent DNA helicase subunit